VLQLLRRFAGSAGLLMVLEDLHWADPDTLAVVEYLSDNLSAEAVPNGPADCPPRGGTRSGRRRRAGVGRRLTGMLASVSRPWLEGEVRP
jgi:hypothetical protein